jgi:ankyrin repeat protein
MKPIHLACLNGNYDVVQLLISAKADLNSTIHTSEKGVNCLHLASGYGFEEIVGLLIDSGMDINKTTSEGSTALHFALKRLKLNVVKYLAKRGINSDSVAMQLAIQTGNLEILEFLEEQNQLKIEAQNN